MYDPIPIIINEKNISPIESAISAFAFTKIVGSNFT